MPKLYHVVVVGENDIISSWKSHDEAVLAIRHLLNPNTVSPNPQDSYCFEEGDHKNRYWARSAHHDAVEIRHSAEEGIAAKPTELAAPLPPLQWGVFSRNHDGYHHLHALYDDLLYANEQGRRIAWEESYTYCKEFEHGCVFLEDLKRAKYTGNMVKKHYGMVDAAYSGAAFKLYVRPVVVNQAPSRKIGSKSKRTAGVKQEEPGSKRVKTEAGIVKSEAKVEADTMSDAADALSDRSSSPEIAEDWPESYGCGTYGCTGGCHKRHLP